MSVKALFENGMFCWGASVSFLTGGDVFIEFSMGASPNTEEAIKNAEEALSRFISKKQAKYPIFDWKKKYILKIECGDSPKPCYLARYRWDGEKLVLLKTETREEVEREETEK